jgi:hypothetical protein
VSEVPEEGRDATGERRANGEPPRNHGWHPGSVCVHSSAHGKYLTENASWPPSDRETGAKAEGAERPRTVEVGGATARAVGERVSHRRVREDGMRPEAPADGRHTSGGATEESPSCGWRKVAEEMGASAGVGHK